MKPPETGILKFVDFALHPPEHCLLKNGEQVHLRPKAFEALVYLVEQRGRLVKKEELLDKLWPEVVVTENALSKCIDDIRHALGDSAREPRFIETVPWLGFRFIAEVEESAPITADAQKASDVAVESQEPSVETTSKTGRRQKSRLSGSRWLIPGISVTVVILLSLVIVWRDTLFKWNETRTDSLAVLPFVNLSGDPKQEYLADGMTEALIANLGKLKALRVISRTSVMTYKNRPTPMPEIARQLNVDAVVEGSILRASDRVRITAKLIDANSDQLLWVKSYKRHIQDILTLQSELAQAIATEIRVELTPQEQTQVFATRPVNPEAYDAYLKGRYFWNKRTSEAFEKAKQQFLKAIEIDSSYAPAYTGLSDTYTLLAGYGILPGDTATAQSKKYALKALELDETLAEAHVALAPNLSNEWDWAGAEREFKRAIELNPNYATAHHWYATHLERFGLLDQAVSEARKALTLAPLSLRIRVDLGRTYFYARRYDEAIQQYRETLELDPNFAPAHSLLGLVYLERGEFEQAITELREGMRLRNGDLSRWLGYAYAVSGRKDEAMNELSKWKQRWQQWHEDAAVLALIYTGLGDEDAAFEWLEKAFEVRDPALFSLKCSPQWDTLRPDERFQNLLRRIGIPADADSRD